MTRLIIKGVEELKSKVGSHLGYSDYMTITQDQVNRFADATGDHQWIHIDIERAKAGPFGGPIAHVIVHDDLAGSVGGARVQLVEGVHEQNAGVDGGTTAANRRAKAQEVHALGVG